MNRLLSKPLKAFAIYSLVILLVSIPAYFWVVDTIWISELDEHNQIIKNRILHRFEQQQLDATQLANVLDAWNTLQPGTALEPLPLPNSQKDSIYEIYKIADYADEQEEDRFRVLQAYIDIHGQPYRLTIETNVEEADETLLAIALVTFFFFILLMLGFILLNRQIALKSWKPFYATLESLKAFDLSLAQEIRLEKSDIYEFQELNDSLAKLVGSNISTYQQQKAFTENASHELQTPIALLKSRLDLLLQEQEVTPRISEMLHSMEAQLARLSRINKNLLLLARVENHQFEAWEMLDTKSALKNAMGLFEDYASDKKLSISSSLEGAPAVRANPFLLETLFNNLLSNAIRYTPDGGQIFIHAQPHAWVFKNSGSKALDANKLFKRFSTASREVVGTGLGLAIVKEITHRYGWDVQYTFQDEMHVFSVIC